MRIVFAAGTSSGGNQPAKSASSIGRWIADRIKLMADYYAAAARYEELSRLSDAELRRRGLSRATLARDVLAAWNRPAAE
jgi:hypothetical protein